MVDKTAEIKRYYTLLFPGGSKDEGESPSEQKSKIYPQITAGHKVFSWKFEAYADKDETHYNLEVFVVAPHATTLNYGTVWAAAKVDERLKNVHKLSKAGYGKVTHGMMVIPDDAKQLGGGAVTSNVL